MTVDEIDLEWNTRIEMYLHFSVLCHFSSCSQQFKSIDEISYEKKNWTQEYLREKIMDLRNTHEEKFCVTKYPREKVLNPQNNHEKKYRAHETPTKAR